MIKRLPFALGWRPLGSGTRRWQLQDCVDVAEAARIAAGPGPFRRGRPVEGLRHGDGPGACRFGPARAQECRRGGCGPSARSVIRPFRLRRVVGS